MSIFGASIYDRARPTGVCAASGSAIPAGERYVAVLIESPAVEGLERRDYSWSAWEAGARPEPPAVVIGSWRAVYDQGERARPLLVDDESIVELFESLLDGAGESAESARRATLRFLLALILMRKRVLRLDSTRGFGTGSVMLLRWTGRFARERGITPEQPGPPIEVVDPGMNDAAIAEAVEELGAVVSGGGGT